MDKEQLNAKLKEIKILAGIKLEKTKEKLDKTFEKENVKKNLKKAKSGIDKAVEGTKNSGAVKGMSGGQKFAALGIAAVILIVIIALIGRFIFAPEPSIWCVAAAPKSELAFNTAGKVIEVAYSEKQIAIKGDTIARVQNETNIADLESAESKSMEANLRYLKMENRFADMENALAESRLKAAESVNEAAIAALELAKEYEKQYRSYRDSGTVSEAHYLASLEAVADAETELKMTEDELDDAKQYLEAVKKGHTPEEIGRAKNEAEAAAEYAAKVKAALEGALIIAPFDAYINSMKVKAGDSVEPGSPVCEVTDMSKIWLRGYADKGLAESLNPGSAVNVEFREIARETFAGKIVSIASDPEQKDGESLYELRIELDSPGHSVLPGMEATAIVVYN